MKRIISIILALIVCVIPLNVSAKGVTNSLFEKLAEYTASERAQYISLIRPFLTTDAGVEAGIDNVNSGIFESMLETKFSDNQKDAMIRLFKSMRCIKQDTGIRLKYADILQNKIPTDITLATKVGIEKMVNVLYDQSPAAKKVMTEDGYTEAVVANALKIIPEVNGGALMTYDAGVFAVKNINSVFENEFDSIWSGYKNSEGKTVTAYKVAEGMANFLNWIPETERLFTAKALETLGVCKIIGEGTVPPVTNTSQTEHYTVIKSMSGVASAVFEGSVVIKTKENIPDVIDILVKSPNPMIYRLVGASILSPVKYSLPTENGIKAEVMPNTVYVIRTAAYPFVDANGWGKSYIAALYARGIINGKSECEFMPDAAITREEFVKLVVELFGLTDDTATTDFTDVLKGSWYYKYVASAKKCGIIGGIGDSKFGTGAYIKRQDMAKIINSVLVANGITLSGNANFNDNDKIADYAKEHVAAISGTIISGDDQGNFNPNKNATRQEAAKMVYGMLNLYILK